MSSIVEQVGRVIGGRYRLLAVVGAGASAQVFAADDTRLSRRVAVKLLHPALAGDATFLRKFQAEARLAASLNHRNVLHVYDWGDEDGVPYLVLEYLGGGSLRSMLDTGFLLSPQQAAAIGAEAANGLAYAHRRSLVHRDIKPANLLFDDDGRLLVADFGLARALAEAAITEPLGAVMGTARYASPEQVEGRPVDDRTDVYSLALTLYESVTGRVPFAGETTVATLMARVGAVLPPARELGPLAPILAQAAISEPLARLDAAGFAYELELLLLELEAPGPLPLTRLYVAAPAVARGLDRDPTERFGVATPQGPVLEVPTPPAPTHVPPAEPRPAQKWSIELDDELPEIDFGPSAASPVANQTPTEAAELTETLEEMTEVDFGPTSEWLAPTELQPTDTGPGLIETVEEPTETDFGSPARSFVPTELHSNEAGLGPTETVEEAAATVIGSAAESFSATQLPPAEAAQEPTETIEDLSEIDLGSTPESLSPTEAAQEPTETVEELTETDLEPPFEPPVPTELHSNEAGLGPTETDLEPPTEPPRSREPKPAEAVQQPAEPTRAALPPGTRAPLPLAQAPAPYVAQSPPTRVQAPTAEAPARPVPPPAAKAPAPPDQAAPVPQTTIARPASPQAAPPPPSTALSSVRRITTPTPVSSPPPELPRERRKHRWLPWLLVVLLAELAGGAAVIAHSRVVHHDTVPPVSGLRFSAARVAIRKTGLYPELIGEQYSERVSAGGVISQSPLSGRSEKAGSIVKVVISKGPHPTTVPSLSRLSGSGASAALRAAHLMAHFSQCYSETVPAGTVVSWSSVAGQRVFYGDTVDVLLSKGPMPQTIPVDLRGGVRTWTQAESALADLHLMPVQNPRYSTTIPAGFVVTTQPAPGTTVPGHSRVLVFVSQGPPFVTVPPVYGKSAIVAEHLLTSLGFKWLPFGPAAASTVLQTLPRPGQSVRYGTTIDIYLY